MKKILKLITPLLATLFLLTACSSEKTKVYTTTFGNDQENETTIFYKGDVVNKIKTISNIKNLGMDSDSAFESIKKSIDEQNKDIKGLTYNVEKKDDKAVITWDLDFSKVDFESIINIFSKMSLHNFYFLSSKNKENEIFDKLTIEHKVNNSAM